MTKTQEAYAAALREHITAAGTLNETHVLRSEIGIPLSGRASLQQTQSEIARADAAEQLVDTTFRLMQQERTATA